MNRFLIALLLLGLTATPALAANEIGDAICESTTTAGTGTVSLDGALSGGYLGFATQITSGAVVPYRISTGTGASRKIEDGTGTFTDGTPDTLTRSVTWSTDGAATALTLSGTSTVCLAVNVDLLTGGFGINADLLSGLTSGLTDPASSDVVVGWNDSSNQIVNKTAGVGLTADADSIDCDTPTTSANGCPELATASEFRTGTDTARALPVDQVWSAAGFVTLTDAVTIAIDFATGLNFQVTLAGNRTLGNPSNDSKPGQVGVLKVTATTSTRTLNISSDWKNCTTCETFPLSITTSETVYITYFNESSTNTRILGIARY